MEVPQLGKPSTAIVPPTIAITHGHTFIVVRTGIAAPRTRMIAFVLKYQYIHVDFWLL